MKILAQVYHLLVLASQRIDQSCVSALFGEAQAAVGTTTAVEHDVCLMFVQEGPQACRRKALTPLVTSSLISSSIPLCCCTFWLRHIPHYTLNSQAHSTETKFNLQTPPNWEPKCKGNIASGDSGTSIFLCRGGYVAHIGAHSCQKAYSKEQNRMVHIYPMPGLTRGVLSLPI